jgi:hypothetical protein
MARVEHIMIYLKSTKMRVEARNPKALASLD